MFYGYVTVYLVVDKPQLKVKNVMTNHITTGMTNYRNGPQYAFNYNGLVSCFGQGCPFWDVLGHIRAHRLTTMDCNEGVYCHNDIATAG